MCDWDNQTIFLEKHFYFNMLFAFIFFEQILKAFKKFFNEIFTFS